MACARHLPRRNNVEEPGTLFASHMRNYRNLITAYDAVTNNK